MRNSISRTDQNQLAANLRVVVIVQVRMGSTRLPGKILKEVQGKSLLTHQIERLRRVALADEIVIATTTNAHDQVIADLCSQEGIACFRGDECDVLDRYYQAAKLFEADVVVRVCGDCPLIDPHIIDDAIRLYKISYPSYDYISNTLKRTYPRGMDVEVFSFASLEKVAKEALLPEEREHVTPYIYRHPELFALANMPCDSDFSFHRWTVDTEEDFQLISTILRELYLKQPEFAMDDVLELFALHPEWMTINAHIKQKTIK